MRRSLTPEARAQFVAQMREQTPERQRVEKERRRQAEARQQLAPTPSMMRENWRRHLQATRRAPREPARPPTARFSPPTSSPYRGTWTDAELGLGYVWQCLTCKAWALGPHQGAEAARAEARAHLRGEGHASAILVLKRRRAAPEIIEEVSP